MWGVQSDTNIVMYFLLANGVRIYDSNEYGKIITRINTPPAYRAMQYIQDLTFVYKTCKISGLTATSPFLLKKASILLTANGSTYNNQLKGKGLGSIGYVPMPLGPDTTERMNATQTAASYLFMSSCRDLEKVIKVMSYTFIGWNPANPNFRTPEEIAAMAMRNWMPDESEKEIPYMLIAHTKSTLMPLPPDLNTIVNTQILQPINAGVDRPATIIDRAMPAIQSTLDELFNR
jgi:hypothetical protein